MVDSDNFVNRSPPGRIIQSGDGFVVVYEPRQTWEAIRTEAERIKAFRDIDGVRWYFVMWQGLGLTIHELDSERLEYFVTLLHQELRKNAN